MALPRTSGVVFIHAATTALRPHVEWGMSAVLGVPVRLDWTPQPAAKGQLRCEFTWHGDAGTGAALASRFAAWQHLRFEVTEDASPGHESHRWSYTPTLGMFHALTGLNGDILVPEDRIKAAVVAEALGGKSLHASLDELLGRPWDDELEVFRQAGDGAPVRWLHAVV